MKVIRGEIEATGQTVFDQRGTVYAYLRLLTDAGNVEMVHNVIVGNTVGSYVRPGARGAFLFCGRRRVKTLAAALLSDGRLADGLAEGRALSRTGRFAALWFGIVGVLALPLFGAGLIFLFAALRALWRTPSVPRMSKAELGALLGGGAAAHPAPAWSPAPNLPAGGAR